MEHGTPFIVRVGPGERMVEVRERMRQRLGTPAEDFATWGLSILHAQPRLPLVPAPDDLYNHLLPVYQVWTQPGILRVPVLGVV